MYNNTQRKSYESSDSFSPSDGTINEEKWTRPQQCLLKVLQCKDHQDTSVTEICQLAGYSSKAPWYRALGDERFATAVQTLGIKITRNTSKFTRNRDMPSVKERLLAVLQQPENRKKPVTKICQLAGFASTTPWMNAIKDEQFVSTVKALGVPIKRHYRTSHLDVEPVTNIEEELAKDVWDIRRLKHEYPKHVSPSDYEVDFSWIVNPLLRKQVKHYFRLRLTRWRAGTFKRTLYHLKTVLILLPPDVYVGTIQRSHVETLLLQ